jgi:hypothetical protein
MQIFLNGCGPAAIQMGGISDDKESYSINISLQNVSGIDGTYFDLIFYECVDNCKDKKINLNDFYPALGIAESVNELGQNMLTIPIKLSQKQKREAAEWIENHESKNIQIALIARFKDCKTVSKENQETSGWRSGGRARQREDKRQRNFPITWGNETTNTTGEWEEQCEIKGGTQFSFWKKNHYLKTSQIITYFDVDEFITKYKLKVNKGKD